MLYIDVTQLIHWPGKLTGIPRVMNEISIRFSTQKNTRFIAWSNKNKQFNEIDLHRTLASRGHHIQYKTADSDLSSKIIPQLHKGVVSTKPYRVAIKYAPGKRTARRIIAYGLQSTRKKIEFTKGDILLVLWGEWSSEAYIKTLKRLNKNKVKIIQFAYDLLPILRPQYSGHSKNSARNYNLNIIPICSLVLCISKSTRDDLTAWLNEQGLTPPPINTFRLGDDFGQASQTKPIDSQFTEGNFKGQDYILCVGTVEARKNHTLLYYVYKLAKARNIKLPPLIIVGRRGWKTDDIYDIITEDPDTANKILFLTDTNDEQLAWLYTNALFSVYPSFYEGWGLPIAESMLHGVPCLSSNTSSMPEIAGDLIDYFSPFSPEECLAAIQKLMTPAGLKAAKEQAKKYKYFSWDNSFDQVNSYVKGLYDTTN